MTTSRFAIAVSAVLLACAPSSSKETDASACTPCTASTQEICLGTAIGTCSAAGCFEEISDCAPGICIVGGHVPSCAPAGTTVHGTAHGLTGSATVTLYSSATGNPLVLTDQASHVLAADGTFTIASTYGTYALAVTAPPAGEACTVSGAASSPVVQCSTAITACDLAGDECFLDPSCPAVSSSQGALFSQTTSACAAGAVCCHRAH